VTLRFAGRLPRALVRVGYRHPWAVLAGAALVIAGGVLLGTRLRFETDVLNLMPRHDPVVTQFKKVLKDFGSLETLLVVVPVNGEDHVEQCLALVDALAEEMKESPYLSEVNAHLEDPVKLAEAVLRHAVLFLDQEGLESLQERLTPKGLEARAADIRAALDTPQGMVAKEFAVRDPVGFLPLLLSRVNRTPAALTVDYTSGYYLSSDHSLVLILAKPKGPAQDIDFDQALMNDLRLRIEKVREQFADDEEVPLAEVPKVEIGGGHRIALEDATLIKRDIANNSITSIVGVLLLFFLAYRRFATAHYALLPLGTGLALTFVFAAVTLGELNSATSGFSALLVGLGIDFTIVTYGRYLEGRLAGRPPNVALDEMAAHTGPAVFLGTITTVGTFYAFLATRFVGLREFGLLTGTGIVFMMFSAFLMLPALVTLFDRDREPKPPPPWLRLGPIMEWAARHRVKVLAAAGVVTILSIAALFWLRFDDDVRNLRSPSNRGVKIQERVAKAFGLSFNAMMIRIQAKDVPEALGRVQELGGGLDKLVKAGVISSYESLANLVPPRAAQERALEWLTTHKELTDPVRVTSETEAALKAAGLVPQAFAQGLAELGEALRPDGPVSLEIWRGTPVEQVIERSLHRSDGTVSTVINVFVPPGEWRREAPPELVALVRGFPWANLTGVNLVAQRLRHTVWQDAALAGALGLVLVLGLLIWDSHSWKLALVCLLPVGTGVLWALGVMAVVGYPLNLLNVFVITMVIGVGSDYAIYMLHRLREGSSREGMAQTARAVTLAALSTIVGFGTLITTHYPGLQSMGWMALLGVSFAWITAVVLVPLVVRPGSAAQRGAGARGGAM
jgi:predicted RND superfamily exporter protein